MNLDLLLYAVAVLLILVGLLGVALPVLPGLPLMFAGMFLAAWIGRFQVISGWTVALLGAMTALALAIDVAASVLGAQRAGASRLALLGASLGLLAGLLFGLPGLLLGPFAGAIAGELASGREWRTASRTGFATWAGLAVGVAVKLAVAFAMLGVFAVAILF